MNATARRRGLPRRTRSLRCWASLAALLALAQTAQAGQSQHPLWEIGLGAGVISLPHYRGSDERQDFFFPMPYLIYRGEVLRVDRESISGRLFTSDRLALDLSLNGSAPVNSGDSVARAGMPDLDPTLELGPQLKLTFFDTAKYRLQARLQWRSVVRYHHGDLVGAGWLVNPILNFDLLDSGPDGGWNLGVSGGPLWANAGNHGYFYDVGEEFATPERPAFSARGGYSGAQATVSLTRRFRRIWVGAFVRVEDLHGAVFDGSPLLETRDDVMAGLSVVWVFAEAERTVLADD